MDIIKFQRFNSTKEISTFAEKLIIKRQSESDSQLELARNLELPDDWLIEAYEYCKKKKVGFLALLLKRKVLILYLIFLDVRLLKFLLQI